MTQFYTNRPTSSGPRLAPPAADVAPITRPAPAPGEPALYLPHTDHVRAAERRAETLGPLQPFASVLTAPSERILTAYEQACERAGESPTELSRRYYNATHYRELTDDALMLIVSDLAEGLVIPRAVIDAEAAIARRDREESAAVVRHVPTTDGTLRFTAEPSVEAIRSLLAEFEDETADRVEQAEAIRLRVRMLVTRAPEDAAKYQAHIGAHPAPGVDTHAAIQIAAELDDHRLLSRTVAGLITQALHAHDDAQARQILETARSLAVQSGEVQP